MNGRGMTPSSTQYQQNPFSTNGGQSTGMSLSHQTSPSTFSQVPPLIRFPAGSPDFSPGPQCTTQPFPTFPDFTQTSPSFHNPLVPASFTPSHTSPSPPWFHNPFAPGSSTPSSSFSNYPLTSPSPSEFHNPLAPTSSTPSSSFYFPQTSPSPSSLYNSQAPAISTPSSSFYFPQTSPSPSSLYNSQAPAISTPSSSFYFPQTSPSPSSFHNSQAPVSSTLSPFSHDSFMHSNPEPWSIPQPSHVFSSTSSGSSTPPSFRRDSFPRSYPGKGSLTYRPILSVLPPSPVYSSNPMVSSSPTSIPLMHPTPSVHVANRDSSIRSNSDHPSLPPRVPVKRSNSAKVSRSNTLHSRKFHKRTNTDITGISSMAPQGSPGASYLELSDMLVGDSSCGEEGFGELIYDEEAMKEFCSEYMILHNNNNGDQNQNVDVLMITNTDSGGPSNANESEFKTGSTTSGVKRRAGKEIEPSRQLYRSASADTCYNSDLIKRRNLQGQVSSSVGRGDKEAADDPKKFQRRLANRAAAARFKEKQTMHILDLERRVKILEKTNASLVGTMTLMEKENMMMMGENKEGKLRVQLLEQKAHLLDKIERLEKEAKEREGVDYSQLKLSEELIAEVNRLKVAAGEGMANPSQFDGSMMQPLDPNMFQLQVNINEVNEVNEFNQQQPNQDFSGH
ncbi:Basic-leucine zipper domain [Arabidopsis thaliana x Arabidopsis arenosa]|uniref:Basic-leucine zipper domain n=1 Tax=Arabidopsis thaliana x Arabidopsis arenosa TaxID=1240361 RepID=A0A8T2A3C7_9BRAS|nr:Basic-leucine zipper domain [Arabidopsis thaliana x Arabidopsis arenosa]